MQIGQVIKAHGPDSASVLTMKTGEILRGERRATEWSGWLWCTNESGLSAWVPEAYLSQLHQPGMYKAIRNYNSFEISVDIGQEITILLEVASWGWVRAKDGTEGWIPLENLKLYSVSCKSRIPKGFCSSLLLSSVI